MAWDWLGPASGAFVGVTGIVGGAWIAGRGRKQDERMAKQRFEHDESMAKQRFQQEQKAAHAQWYREKRAEAYVVLIDMAEGMGQWVLRVHPMWGSAPPPEMPTEAEQKQAATMIRAFGSAEVAGQMELWRRTVWDAVKAAKGVDRGEADADQRLNDLRRVEGRQREELGNLINAELGSVSLP